MGRVSSLPQLDPRGMHAGACSVYLPKLQSLKFLNLLSISFLSCQKKSQLHKVKTLPRDNIM